MGKRSGAVDPQYIKRVSLRRELEIAASFWADCDDEDREEMRQEITEHLAQLELDLQRSNLDHVSEVEIMQRIQSLRNSIQ